MSSGNVTLIDTQKDSKPQNRYGWAGSIESFLKLCQEEWLKCVSSPRVNPYLETISEQQMSAWKNCFNIMSRQLNDLVINRPEVKTWGIIFEYELPRERGRRPDVIILTSTEAFVLEFKDYSGLNEAFLDQTLSYARDLQYYHSVSQRLANIPILILTYSENDHTANGVHVIGPNYIHQKLSSLSTSGVVASEALENWLTGEYAPLPTLVDAARMIFNNEPLPQIKRALSAGIPQTLTVLEKSVESARQNGDLHLALVTGVPGAGKTLVGLQFVYSSRTTSEAGERQAVFLSGNKPLVKVLQHALKNKIFVQDVHGFLKEYGGNQSTPPEEHIWVYDEAQRAWDAERVLKYRGHQNSEPTDFLKIGERMGSWAMMVGLIGEGQEIHIGEEAGLRQWNDAIALIKKPCIVHCAPRVAPIFTNASKVVVEPRLDLTISIRSHLAENVQQWVSQLLDGKIDVLDKLASNIQSQGFGLYVTRSLEAAKNYAKQRYNGAIDKKFGLIASSKDCVLPKYGVMNDYNSTQRLKIGPWFNDEPSSQKSCCQLRDVATEFQCQGLELDLPIVCWENDLLWIDKKWWPKPQPRSKAINPNQLRINSYRVLLTRGRDGIVVFVPGESQYDNTYSVLRAAGMTPIS